MKSALVLSAGGMFGAYQAGAWKALAPALRPDLVVGTSAGAINGWAIASGATPEQLIARWLDPRTRLLMRYRGPAPPWRGCFDPHPLEEYARELLETLRPRIPFAGTMVEVPSLRSRIVRDGEMTWRHLLAMCAVPFGFPPVRIEGRTYVDGGLMSVLPVWAAAELGAEEAVAVNALPIMPSRLIRTSTGMLRWFVRTKKTPAGMPVRLIRPDPPLGTLSQSITWDETSIRRWIERGERDAEAMLREVESPDQVH